MNEIDAISVNILSVFLCLIFDPFLVQRLEYFQPVLVKIETTAGLSATERCDQLSKARATEWMSFFFVSEMCHCQQIEFISWDVYIYYLLYRCIC